jgi:hypothetical protein
MSVPPPSTSTAGSGPANAWREFVVALEPERSWKRRGGEDALRLSATGAVIEHERMLRQPLRLPLGVLGLGLVERGGADARGRFAILRRLSATTVLPREHGIEGWLWTQQGGSALTLLGDEEQAPNVALLFTKPLAEELVTASFTDDALAEIIAGSPLGAPAVHGLLFRVGDPSAAETVFRRFNLMRPLTDREVPPTMRRSLPTDRPADPALVARDDVHAATSVAPPGMG